MTLIQATSVELVIKNVDVFAVLISLNILSTKFWQAFPVGNVIKLFGGNLDFPKMKKLEKVWSDN